MPEPRAPQGARESEVSRDALGYVERRIRLLEATRGRTTTTNVSLDNLYRIRAALLSTPAPHGEPPRPEPERLRTRLRRISRQVTDGDWIDAVDALDALAEEAAPAGETLEELRSNIEEAIDQHIYMDSSGWRINRASLRLTAHRILALVSPVLEHERAAREQAERERDEAEMRRLEHAETQGAYIREWKARAEAAEAALREYIEIALPMFRDAVDAAIASIIDGATPEESTTRLRMVVEERINRLNEIERRTLAARRASGEGGTDG